MFICIDRAKNGLKTITGEFQNISLPKLSNQELDEINNYRNLKINTISELKVLVMKIVILVLLPHLC